MSETTAAGWGEGLGAAWAALRCPVCHGVMRAVGPADGSGDEAQGLLCGAGHRFDRARQGYVTLRSGHKNSQNADTAPMVMARERLLAGGWYEPIATALAQAVKAHARPEGVLVDLAGGTGYYGAAVLDALPGWEGICLDISTPALKRAARAHGRLVAVGGDALGRLPLGDKTADAVVSVFGPRVPEEIARVLAPGGVLAVVTPMPGHLAEVQQAVDGVAIHPGKPERLAQQFASLTRVASEEVVKGVTFSAQAARDVVLMGPTGHHHAEADIDAATLPTATTIAVRIDVWKA